METEKIDAVAVVDSSAPMDWLQSQSMSVESVLAHQRKIDEIVEKVMVDGVHSGKIPGCKQKALFQPGAETLCRVFRLVPTFRFERTELPGGHIEVRSFCAIHGGNAEGPVLGEGNGTCSTMESKYRWRKQYTETEAGPIPKGYWEVPKEQSEARQSILVGVYGPGRYRVKKAGAQWVAVKVEGDGERIENPDIADTYNTVEQMSAKRSHVAATKRVTATSHLFVLETPEMETSVNVHRAEDEDIPPMRTQQPASAPTPPPTEEKPSPKESLAYHNYTNKGPFEVAWDIHHDISAADKAVWGKSEGKLLTDLTDGSLMGHWSVAHDIIRKDGRVEKAVAMLKGAAVVLASRGKGERVLFLDKEEESKQ